MTGRFTVLASGSSGNAALLESNGFGLLIDCGLHPRVLGARLREIGASWEKVNAVILTHTHGDHWKDLTLGELRSRRILLYAHPEHHDQLGSSARSFDALRRAGLTRTYSEEGAVELTAGFVVRPVRVEHDAEPTFAFRIDQCDSGKLAWSVGYASDLGCGSSALVNALAGVDVLALEFNHDVRMERRSRRPRFLIDRVLSDCGHLSNEQAAKLAVAIAARSGEGFPGHLIQLHLSRECNRPEIAATAGQAALAAINPLVEVVTARQDVATKSISLTRRSNSPVGFGPRRGADGVVRRQNGAAALAWLRLTRIHEVCRLCGRALPLTGQFPSRSQSPQFAAVDHSGRRRSRWWNVWLHGGLSMKRLAAWMLLSVLLQGTGTGAEPTPPPTTPQVAAPALKRDSSVLPAAGIAGRVGTLRERIGLSVRANKTGEAVEPVEASPSPVVPGCDHCAPANRECGGSVVPGSPIKRWLCFRPTSGHELPWLRPCPYIGPITGQFRCGTAGCTSCGDQAESAGGAGCAKGAGGLERSGVLGRGGRGSREWLLRSADR